MKKWKFVFGFSLLLFCLDLIQTPFQEQLGLGNFIALIFGGLTLIPLYGFAYQVAVGNKPIAIGIFFVNTFLFCLGLVRAVNIFIAEPGFAQFIFSILGIGFFLVILYPQYKYAFKSSSLWASNA